MEARKPGQLGREFAKGAVPVALFFAFCGLTAVMETFGLIPAALALLSFSMLTPSVILGASSRYTAAVAATLGAALVCAGIAVGSWATVPVVWVLMMPASAAIGVLRARERSGKERWTDIPLAFAAGAPAMVLAIVSVPWGTTATGILTLLLIGGLLAARFRYGPPPALD